MHGSLALSSRFLAGIVYIWHSPFDFNMVWNSGPKHNDSQRRHITVRRVKTFDLSSKSQSSLRPAGFAVIGATQGLICRASGLHSGSEGSEGSELQPGSRHLSMACRSIGKLQPVQSSWRGWHSGQISRKCKPNDLK